ncbi:MAG: InlB B-repeat-containing protein, partial [Oscillospiraceae bacterium]|nr:InlB B-repeat-containing protein [Oscillospiraceae bacterium]
DNTFVMPASDVTLVAHWTPIPKYTLTYDFNNGTSTTLVYTQKEGDSITVASTIPTQDGYIFDYWIYQGGLSSDPNNGLPFNKVNTFVMPASDVTLVAQWTPISKYTLTYDYNNGIDTPLVAGSYIKGDPITVISSILTYPGYKFAGWKNNVDGKIYLNPSTFAMPANDVTLIAQWTPISKYTLTYDYNNGIDKPSVAGLYNEGDSITVTSSIPVYPGYEFAGWKNNVDGNIYWNPGGFAMPASVVTLIAQWTPISKYTLTYDYNNGIDKPSVAGLYNEGDSITVTASIPTYPGYKFAGWKNNVDGKIYLNPSTFTMPAANVTLIAQWTPIDTTEKLQVTKTASPMNPQPGQTVTYTITVKNISADPLNTIDVSDVMLSDLKLTDGDPSSLLPQATLTYTGHFVVPSDIKSGTVISNTATASANDNKVIVTGTGSVNITVASNKAQAVPNTPIVVVTSPPTPPVIVDDPFIHNTTSNPTPTPIPNSTEIKIKPLKDAIIKATDITLKMGDKFDIMNNVKAIDNGGKGKDITNKVTVNGQINTYLPGKYTFTYSVIGENKVRTTKTITVTIVDTTPKGPRKCEVVSVG